MSTKARTNTKYQTSRGQNSYSSFAELKLSISSPSRLKLLIDKLFVSDLRLVSHLNLTLRLKKSVTCHDVRPFPLSPEFPIIPHAGLTCNLVFARFFLAHAAISLVPTNWEPGTGNPTSHRGDLVRLFLNSGAVSIDLGAPFAQGGTGLRQGDVLGVEDGGGEQETVEFSSKRCSICLTWERLSSFRKHLCSSWTLRIVLWYCEFSSFVVLRWES